MPEVQRFLEPADGGWSWSRRAREQADARGRERSSAGGSAGVGPDGPDSEEYLGPGPEHDLPTFVISVAAEMAELHPQTLRAYERDGLLTPYRTPGGTRRYSLRDVERLRLIRRLTQDEGLNLAGVRLVLEMGERLEHSRRRVSELEEMVRVLAARLEQRPATSRFEIVKAPQAGVELHRASRRTGTRSAPQVQRARPLPPPELRTLEAHPLEPRA
jgi:MerR family transcriptional regulator, heat shock protein HspR